MRNFDLLKAFGSIEKVVKSDFFFLENGFILHHSCATCSELPPYIYIYDSVYIMVTKGLGIPVYQIWTMYCVNNQILL